jgi:hypothetical protein
MKPGSMSDYANLITTIAAIEHRLVRTLRGSH